MAPFSVSESIQNRSKLDPEGHPKIDTFSHRLPTLFCSILAPKMDPCWDQVGTKIASRAGPDLTWPDQTPALRPPQQPLGLPNLPKEGKISQNGPMFDRFSMILGPILGRIFDHFLFFWELIFHHFGIKFYS